MQRHHERDGEQRSGSPPCCSATTRWPQIQPVSAPKAPVSAGHQEQGDGDQAPPRLDEQSARRSPGPGSGTPRAAGGAGGSPERRAVPTWRRCCSPGRLAGRPPPRRPPRAACGRGRARRPAGPASRAGRPGPPSSTATCSARSVVDNRCATSRPVRPASRRSAARTTWVSVTGSIRAVASSSTTTRTSRTSRRANATSCSSPEDSVVPPGPSRVSRPVGQAGHPVVEPELGDGRLHLDPRGTGAKSVMFSARVPAMISVRWVTTPTAERSSLQVDLEHVDTAEQHRSRAPAPPHGRAGRPASTCPTRSVRRGRRWCRPGTCRSTCWRAKRPSS